MDIAGFVPAFCLTARETVNYVRGGYRPEKKLKALC
jgi:hypothetical protein